MAINNLFDQINIRGYVDGWAKITIDLWQKELRKKKIGITDDLYNSFQKQVQRKGSEIAEIILKFKMYGRFRDMGVGNGLKAYERGSNKQDRTASKRYGANVGFSDRSEKRWLNKIKTAQTYRLSEILGQRAGTALIKDFINTNTVSIQING
jgi:hypothetical protein